MTEKDPKAERQARLARQAVEGVAAAKEYRAQFDRTLANTARLRAERLVREADAQQEAEAERASTPVAKPPSKRQTKSQGKPSAKPRGDKRPRSRLLPSAVGTAT
ncbi:MAG: hypothetical protein JOZ70_12275 [Pseudolabrys sp.]|nr:hypothetical protein [Pseudolabrys sp.]